MITGYATPEGTKKFADRQQVASQQNYKNIHNLRYRMWVSVLILEIQILKQIN